MESRIPALRFARNPTVIARAAVELDASSRSTLLQGVDNARPVVLVVARDPNKSSPTLSGLAALVGWRVQHQVRSRPLWKYLRTQAPDVALIDTPYAYPSHLLHAIHELLLPTRAAHAMPTGTALLLGVPFRTWSGVAHSSGAAVTTAAHGTSLWTLFGRPPVKVHEIVLREWPGTSELARYVHQLAMHVARDDEPRLLRGETSTGKRERLQVVGKGRDAPFVRVDHDGYLSERDFGRCLVGMSPPRRGSRFE